MIGKRLGKYSFKKLQIVETKAEFDAITNPYEFLSNEPKQQMDQYIIIPSYQKIQPICIQKNKKIPQSYIKTRQIKQLMNYQKYQLDEMDLCFLQNNVKLLKNQQFCFILIALEKYAHKYGCQFNWEIQLENIVNKLNIVIDDDIKKNTYYLIYSYWKSKRNNIKSPLLRKYWQKNELGPYKNRQLEQNIYLRNRSLKIDIDQIKQILKEDLFIIKKILELMELREIQEKKLFTLQKQAFVKNCAKVVNTMLNNQNGMSMIGENQNKKVQQKVNTNKFRRDKFGKFMKKISENSITQQNN